MKGRSLSILGIIAAAVGAVFIIACKSLNMEVLAIACGAIFVASGLINLIVFGSAKSDRGTMSFISSAASIVLGITMLAYVANFVTMMPFMLSMLAAACALWQFVTLGLATRPYQLPAWLYSFPLLMTAGAIYIFIIKDSDDQSLILVSTGIILVLLGAGCIIEGSALGVARRRHNKEILQSQQTADDSKAASADAQQPAETGDIQNATKSETRKQRVETTDDLDDEVG